MKLAVIAFGGNAFMGEENHGRHQDQLAFANDISGELVKLVESGYGIVITHGNGPQVGNFMLQQEYASLDVPSMPSDVCGAMTQGQIGYLIVQTLRNHLRKNGLDRPVVAVITQVVVDENDKAFSNPTKFIGPFFDRETADSLAREKNWKIKKDSNRGYRRVVPSPKPLDIVEKKEIVDLIKRGFIVVACGGGGIPVVCGENEEFRGVEGVIDKDMASERLATLIGAETLAIITPVDRISLFFGTQKQVELEKITVDEAEKYLGEGHFPLGSMGPKIEAAIRFLREGGRRVVITSSKSTVKAFLGEKGTEIVRES
ncbi:MAG: carbamate kinase [Candidatus Dadabacteria bacterium]|nr:carbamate kinase [Candidatus Dadabacteria bacterium]MCY4261921.1 carbamate kinase [Candidatus Dadabacteria bacterium]